MINMPFAIGDIFELAGDEDPEEYCLFHVGGRKVVLISLSSCNRWIDPVKVEDCHSITEDELKIIFNGERGFIRTKNVYKRHSNIEANKIPKKIVRRLEI